MLRHTHHADSRVCLSRTGAPVSALPINGCNAAYDLPYDNRYRRAVMTGFRLEPSYCAICAPAVLTASRPTSLSFPCPFIDIPPSLYSAGYLECPCSDLGCLFAIAKIHMPSLRSWRMPRLKESEVGRSLFHQLRFEKDGADGGGLYSYGGVCVALLCAGVVLAIAAHKERLSFVCSGG